MASSCGEAGAAVTMRLGVEGEVVGLNAHSSGVGGLDWSKKWPRQTIPLPLFGVAAQDSAENGRYRARGLKARFLTHSQDCLMPKSASTTLPTRLLTWRWPLCALFVNLAGVALQARANDPEPKKLTVIQPNALKAKAEAAGTIIKHEPISKDQLKETIQGAKGKSQSVNLVVNDKGASSHAAPAAAPHIHAPAAPSYTKTTAAPIVRLDDGPSGRLPSPVDSQTSRQYIRAKAAAMTGHTPATAGAGDHGSGHDIHWAYEGEGGPQAWGKLKPEFETCAVGKRQSPIHIERQHASGTGRSVDAQLLGQQRHGGQQRAHHPGGCGG